MNTLPVQVMRFGAVGLTAVALAYVQYQWLISQGLGSGAAYFIAYGCSLVVSFFLNRSWTFRHDTSGFDASIRFLLVHASSYCASMLTHQVSVHLLVPHQSAHTLAFFLAIAVSTLINFVGSKYFVYTAPGHASKTLFLKGPFFPPHSANRMKSEGALIQARANFLRDRFRNLDFLLRQRYAWMNPYLGDDAVVLEIGSGAGFAELYLKRRPIFTDAIAHPWIDRVLDATHMDLENSSIDCIIASHNIHHFYSPYKFFKGCERLLKPGGVVLIQELNTSLMLRLLLRLMRHEGWSYEVKVFDEFAIANDPSDPWSANCAIPQLLFEDPGRFEAEFPQLKVEKNALGEFLLFPLSGGVIAKTAMPQLPVWLLRAVQQLDRALVALAPSVFAMGRSVVLRKKAI
ncbi:MAG: GtrA family protein [Pseudomonadota bacterium]